MKFEFPEIAKVSFETENLASNFNGGINIDNIGGPSGPEI